ncbi:tRNA (N6-isopentenyl adenosine(37)-C2)-methylthiotransferase MiaB [Candidatus Azoamicus ciliaticola]|nr:tRNA (N6-isopentenyl adenosine(37)-C2)-methylthiotransferase MiaB [Candidatus Azoamicus ciliaticola]
MKQVYIKTLGCQMNEYDSSLILNVLSKKFFFKEVSDFSNADILILNTCSVRDKVDKKVISELGLWNKLRQTRDIVICVGGCFAASDKDFFIKKLSFINVIFGPQSLHRVGDMICEYLNTRKLVLDIQSSNLNKFNYVYDLYNHVDFSSCVSIMEGCDRYCSYCIVPFSRGKEISRSFNSIISEIYTLLIDGVKEIILLGQNIGSYVNVIDNGISIDFAYLLDYISNIEGIGRVKFVSLHPLDFSDELLKVFNRSNVFSKHIHLPVQSGSDSILNLMKRGHSVLDYINIFNKIKNISGYLSVSTDIIVGFPGETDNDFDLTVDLVKKLKFDKSFVYIYSKRNKTIASNLKDNISFEKKKYRLQVLNDILFDNAFNITSSMVGSVQRVIVYKKLEDQFFLGKTDNNRSVVFSSFNNLVGDVLFVKIEKFVDFFLYGKIFF